MNYKHSRLVTWISTSERMPEPDKLILLIVNEHLRQVAIAQALFW